MPPYSSKTWLALLAWLLLFAPPLLGDTDALTGLRVLLSALMLWPLVYTRVTRALALGALVAIGLGNVLHTAYFHELINEFFIATALRTNAGEAQTFLSTLSAGALWRGAVWLGVAGAAAWAVWRHAPQWRERHQRPAVRRLAWVAAGLWLLILGWALSKESSPQRVVRLIRHVYPLHLADALVRQRVLVDALFAAPRLPSVTATGPRADVVVVVLGESASAARWSLLGYGGADTNGPLADIRGLQVERAVARGFTTAAALPYVLTGLSASDSVAQRAPSWLDFTHGAAGGYKTFVFTNSRFFDSGEDFITQALRRAADVFQKVGDGAHDGVLTAYLQQALRDSAPRKLIVLHTYGSHFKIKERYPAGYRLPDDYDNSIRYTSDLLAQWIGLVQQAAGQQAAVLLYTSDHGVVLPPCASEIHHGAARTSLEVPLLTWGNDALRARLPQLLPDAGERERTPALEGNARLGQLVLRATGFAAVSARAPWTQAEQPLFDGQPWAEVRQRDACTLR